MKTQEILLLFHSDNQKSIPKIKENLKNTLDSLGKEGIIHEVNENAELKKDDLAEETVLVMLYNPGLGSSKILKDLVDFRKQELIQHIFLFLPSGGESASLPAEFDSIANLQHGMIFLAASQDSVSLSDSEMQKFSEMVEAFFSKSSRKKYSPGFLAGLLILLLIPAGFLVNGFLNADYLDVVKRVLQINDTQPTKTPIVPPAGFWVEEEFSLNILTENWAVRTVSEDGKSLQTRVSSGFLTILNPEAVAASTVWLENSTEMDFSSLYLLEFAIQVEADQIPSDAAAVMKLELKRVTDDTGLLECQIIGGQTSQLACYLTGDHQSPLMIGTPFEMENEQYCIVRLLFDQNAGSVQAFYNEQYGGIIMIPVWEPYELVLDLAAEYQGMDSAKVIFRLDYVKAGYQ